MDPRILDLGTSWKCVVIFMPWPLYPRRNHRSDMGLGGPLEPV
jgi:hypothetical protein